MDWSLMALSVQRGYIAPLKSMLQLKLELVRKNMKILRVGNAQNEPVTINNFSIWFL